MMRVGVLVDLEWSPEAGGHVKCWERLAAAAARRPEAIDLTVHFSGRETGEHRVASNVRYRLHRPVFSTRNLGFLSRVPAHTDLAPYHPGLARWLADYDVIHTTDGYFAFAATARRVARKRGLPLVDSVHTDTPAYSRIYAKRTLEAWGWVGAAVERLFDIPARAERRALWSLVHHQAAADAVLVSRGQDRERAARVQPPERIGRLRRGVDKTRFSPNRRDRAWLAAQYGIPKDRIVVLFAGRLSRGKSIGVLVEAVRRLLAGGNDLHLVCAGEGEERDAIGAALGGHATCPGFVGGDDLARLYASADLFALPSEAEIFANVLQESLASGVPALATRLAGGSDVIRDGETGLLLERADADPWEAALDSLLADPERRLAMAAAARAAIPSLPTWDDVLAEDLLPVWRRVAEEKPRVR